MQTIRICTLYPKSESGRQPDRHSEHRKSQSETARKELELAYGLVYAEDMKKPESQINPANLALFQSGNAGLHEWEQALKRSGIDLMFRQNPEGRIYGITYIDHKNKVVFNGSELGKGYSTKAILDRLAIPENRQNDLSHSDTVGGGDRTAKNTNDREQGIPYHKRGYGCPAIGKPAGYFIAGRGGQRLRSL